MVQLGFIRSLARFFLDTATQNGKNAGAESFKSTHTIDELYQLAHPDWNSNQVKLNSYPLKRIIDKIQVRDALVDLDPSTKDLPIAHFDAESFVEANRRIMDLRKKSKYNCLNVMNISLYLVVEAANGSSNDLDSARGNIGDLLHTLQDFYSHSNWVEMGKTEINDRIGLDENIGQIADVNQATCISDGCKKVQSKCV